MGKENGSGSIKTIEQRLTELEIWREGVVWSLERIVKALHAYDDELAGHCKTLKALADELYDVDVKASRR